MRVHRVTFEKPGVVNDSRGLEFIYVVDLSFSLHRKFSQKSLSALSKVTLSALVNVATYAWRE